MLNQSIENAYRALSVINLDNRIRAFLLHQDPAALHQVNRAILNLETQFPELVDRFGSRAQSNTRNIHKAPEFEIFEPLQEGDRWWATIDLRDWFPGYNSNNDISRYLEARGVCAGVEIDPESCQSYFYFPTEEAGLAFKARLQNFIRTSH